MEPKLVFREEDHKYFLDGKEIPSVSELTRFLGREIYGDVDPIAMDRAAERGTAVHEALQKLDETGEVEVPDEYAGYVQAYMKFLEEHVVVWTGIEVMVHNEDKYAGRIDRIGAVDNNICILDFKTTSRITRQHCVLYSAALTLYWQACYSDVCTLFVLQLKRDGTYKLLPVKLDPALASSCIILHNALRAAKETRARKKATEDPSKTDKAKRLDWELLKSAIELRPDNPSADPKVWAALWDAAEEQLGK